MARLTLDACVAIALLDRRDPHHQSAVDEVAAADSTGVDLLLPATALSETLVSFARAGMVEHARAAIASMGIATVVLSEEIAARAATIRATEKDLRLPDALVVATALEHESMLLTYDRSLKAAATRLGVHRSAA